MILTMVLFDTCPGSANLRTPTLAVKRCPQCGNEVEIFSNEPSTTCDSCGFVIWNDFVSCIRWCRYAEQCMGEETVRKFREREEGGEK
ncbi:MAG: hypothetical protein LUQ42_00005 [Methanomicrobiales archaeon]|nr:hypothetical protein [Methanomicrobiales archaeon]MDD1647645.1 hypothetical protein [Methanomicrobiales archaeon]